MSILTIRLFSPFICVLLFATAMSSYAEDPKKDKPSPSASISPSPSPTKSNKKPRPSNSVTSQEKKAAPPASPGSTVSSYSWGATNQKSQQNSKPSPTPTPSPKKP